MQLTDAWRYRPTVIEQTDQSRQIIEVQTAVLDGRIVWTVSTVGCSD